ncbi:hypothetical protein EPI10_005416 [Gossypium australe]|uniref:Uncharacterized protein n=1 Tax=Gossypium australe TaxID=47621 RepID=A0A5B6WQC9_9ROSI|nr:hypothetical protein EPI10_005416 [Gossypium australe]
MTKCSKKFSIIFFIYGSSIEGIYCQKSCRDLESSCIPKSFGKSSRVDCQCVKLETSRSIAKILREGALQCHYTQKWYLLRFHTWKEFKPTIEQFTTEQTNQKNVVKESNCATNKNGTAKQYQQSEGRPPPLFPLQFQKSKQDF